MSAFPSLAAINDAVTKSLHVENKPTNVASNARRKSIIQQKIEDEEKHLEPPRSIIQPLSKGLKIQPISVKVGGRSNKIHPEGDWGGDEAPGAAPGPRRLYLPLKEHNLSSSSHSSTTASITIARKKKKKSQVDKPAKIDEAVKVSAKPEPVVASDYIRPKSQGPAPLTLLTIDNDLTMDNHPHFPDWHG